VTNWNKSNNLNELTNMVRFFWFIVFSNIYIDSSSISNFTVFSWAWFCHSENHWISTLATEIQEYCSWKRFKGSWLDFRIRNQVEYKVWK
jgi:hypothetical protein